MIKTGMEILGGIGAGAALMYLLDPDRGSRRRALIRDKAVSISKQTRKAIAGKAEDLQNRTKGLIHEAKSTLTRPETQSTARQVH